MSLLRHGEREVVSSMVCESFEEKGHNKQPADGEMSLCRNYPQRYRELVGQNIFYRVTVDCNYGYWGGPFMMDFVDVLIKYSVMKKSVEKEKKLACS